MGFNEFLSSIFGNKSTRDMKEIQAVGGENQSRLPGSEPNSTTTPSAPRRKNSKAYIHDSASRTNARKWKN